MQLWSFKPPKLNQHLFEEYSTWTYVLFLISKLSRLQVSTIFKGKVTYLFFWQKGTKGPAGRPKGSAAGCLRSSWDCCTANKQAIKEKFCLLHSYWCKGWRSLSLRLCSEKRHFRTASKLSEATRPRLSNAFAGWISEAKSVSWLGGKSLWDLTLATLSLFTHKTKWALDFACLRVWTQVPVCRSRESRMIPWQQSALCIPQQRRKRLEERTARLRVLPSGYRSSSADLLFLIQCATKKQRNFCQHRSQLQES